MDGHMQTSINIKFAACWRGRWMLQLLCAQWAWPGRWTHYPSESFCSPGRRCCLAAAAALTFSTSVEP